MSNITTLSGTQIIDGIEYNDYPAPNMLVKAMELVWAKKLITEGGIRLSPLSYYQNLENTELGDNLEGLGALNMNSHPYSIDSINEIFIWCCANPETDQSTLLSLDSGYDVIIKVTDTVKFIKRIDEALHYNNDSFSPPQVGEVNYNRSSEVTKKSLQQQQWQWNAFQKDPYYMHQNEFRFVFSDSSLTPPQGQAINLLIGNCEDIIELIKT